MQLVSDEQMFRAISRLLLEEHVLAEPAGAATAVFLAIGTSHAGKSVVLLVTGANIPPEVLRRAVST